MLSGDCHPLLNGNTIQLIIHTQSVHVGAQLTGSQYNAPPTFVLPANLDVPEKLTIVGNNSQLFNTLICAAKNADNIEWKHRKSLASGYSIIPSPFTQTEIEERDGVLYRSLTDSESPSLLNERQNLNGYYQCIASNKHGRTTITPPIRLILACELVPPVCHLFSYEDLSNQYWIPYLFC